jgi:O-acetyl-ADP-ribose deacetylase (regulator of RNase III)
MFVEKQVNHSKVRVVKDDITAMDIEAFVFYARPDLELGSGFGNAISVRGGPSIQKELKDVGSLPVGEAVVTAAGELKAKHIVHAVGPAFQEQDTEGKLRTTIINTLKRAEEKGIQHIAFPAMGAGFYGVPLTESARITLGTIMDYLKGETRLKEVVVALNDSREYKPFHARLEELS